MHRKLGTAAVATGLALAAGPLPTVAQPSSYGFDDIALVGQHCLNGTSFSAGGGFAWTGFWAYTNALHDCGPLTGLDAGVVSPANATFFAALPAGGALLTISRATPFVFRGAYFTRASSLFDNPIFLDLSGWRAGSPVGAATLQVGRDTPTFLSASFRGVDMVTLHARLGPGAAASDVVAMDDFRFSEIPEPRTGALLAAGLLAATRACRRRRSVRARRREPTDAG